MATVPPQQKRMGLAYWMKEVLDQAEKAADGFKADPVHDLRTALRRCRSIADGLMVFDSDPAWKKMKKAGKQLFQSLGQLRDAHVLTDWIEVLALKDDPAYSVFEDLLAAKEAELRTAARAALDDFDRAKWTE